MGFGTGTDAASAIARPRIRWEVPVEVDGDSVTAILPAQQMVAYRFGPELRWYPRPFYPGASVIASVDARSRSPITLAAAMPIPTNTSDGRAVISASTTARRGADRERHG